MPEDFGGEFNLVVVAFKSEQQALVDTWLGPARELAARKPNFRYYELPTIYEASALVRFWIDNGMRSGISDKTARETTITLSLDKEEFRPALDMPSEDDIYVFLVDKEGRVAWRTNGVYTEDKRQEIETLVAWQFVGR